MSAIRRARMAVVVLLAMAGCGPRPSVDSVTRQPGSPYRIDAMVVNHGGNGQIEVQASLIDPQSREVVAREAKEVMIRRGERVHLAFALAVPDGAEPRSEAVASALQVTVEASYPVQ
jgi:hypothetical protein